MDCKKVGKLILSLRKEKRMTQKQLAEAMNVSDKTISKWERGLGCPDVSLLSGLSAVLGVNIEELLSGALSPNRADAGNMRKLEFYLCPRCGNVMTSTGKAEFSCCGRRLAPLVAKPHDAEHELGIETVEDDCYVTFAHDMTKAHYITFVAYVAYDRVLIVKLYPEQAAEARFPMLRGGKLYYCCNLHGLWVI